MVQYDKKRYWTYFLIWIIGIFVSFFSFVFVSRLLLKLLKGIITDEYQVLVLTVGVFFLPLIVIGVYGLIQGYCMNGRINYIRRGRWATGANIFFIVLYFLILLWVFVISSYEQLQ